MTKWNKSVLSMARRDNALGAVEKQHRTLQQRIQTVHMEVKGCKAQIGVVHEENEKYTDVLVRVSTEVKFMKIIIDKNANQRTALHKQYKVLQKDLESHDVVMVKLVNDKKAVQSSMHELHKKYEVQVQIKQKLDKELVENVSSQTTLEKGAQNVLKSLLKVKKNIHEKYMKTVDVKNELARIGVDSLNTHARNKQLDNSLKERSKELKEMDQLIEKYEQEIRQIIDSVEKKQIYVDRLNRKFDKLVGDKEDENTGPLEATINNLTKEITKKSSECGEMQREWVRYMMYDMWCMMYDV